MRPLVISPDNQAPSGTITAPANGATISGAAYSLTITATDNSGVAGVQWKLDGVNQGAEVTAAPFTKVIDTRPISDGSHLITAVVRDNTAHTTTVSVTAIVNNNPGGGNFGFGWDPTGGTGRRPYSFSSGNFGSPNYIDNNGWSWGGNAFSAHYKLQMRYTMAGLESINGPQSLQNHAYALEIGGNNEHQFNNSPVGGLQDTGWFDVPDAHSGGVQFRDWADGSGAGGTANVGEVILYYQYVWTH